MRSLISTRLFSRRLIQSNNSFRKSSSLFKFSDLEITLASGSQKKPKPDPSTLVFGASFSDHMFEVEWNEAGGWGTPRILPLHPFTMHPGAKVFHYAQASFEGMKAFKRTDQRVALFRPELNIDRLLQSSERASLPTFDRVELLKCLKALVAIDKDWVPDKESCSLYIRPTFIGHESSLGVSSSKSALLYIVLCPVGPYFKTSTAQPVSLLADPNYVRAFQGGAGSHKLAANYAPTLHVQKMAQKQGLDQVLWLSGKDHQVAEAGAMNAFFLLKKREGGLELVTPPLDGTILPGVTRRSILDLAKEWAEFEVSERVIDMTEVVAANKEDRLVEMFLCGTACSVCPVKSIRFMGEDIQIPTMEGESPLFSRILKTLADIQYGRIRSDWSVPVE